MPASSDTGFPYHRIAADLRESILTDRHEFRYEVEL
jgi:hypothetical protein